MNKVMRSLAFILAASMPLLWSSSGWATSLIRMDLRGLANNNEYIALGQVEKISSYWNKEGTFILTDVSVKVAEAIKGDIGRSIIFTVLGGEVDGLSAIIVGGPQIEIGKQYLFFLKKQKLPGAEELLTLPDHCQGIFDVIEKSGDIRAVSQASNYHLVPDIFGRSMAPGGVEGILLPELLKDIRAFSVNGGSSNGR